MDRKYGLGIGNTDYGQDLFNWSIFKLDLQDHKIGKLYMQPL